MNLYPHEGKSETKEPLLQRSCPRGIISKKSAFSDQGGIKKNRRGPDELDPLKELHGKKRGGLGKCLKG